MVVYFNLKIKLNRIGWTKLFPDRHVYGSRSL
jgi:hypothetical protein